VQKTTAACRGSDRAVKFRSTPWVDWANYWATGDSSSKSRSLFNVGHLGPNGRGIDGALLDLEYQRIELIKFNLLDNSGTYRDYVNGDHGQSGRTLKVWPEMRLPEKHAYYDQVGGAGPQLCTGQLIRFRNLTGVCNDIRNPAMGSTGQLLARNVEFTSTFPDLGDDTLARNRHGDRIGPMKPDPQVISRRLFTRRQTHPELCEGKPTDSECDYVKAPFFNVLAAFWIQFMTHDWFSHLKDGHNDASAPPMSTGCRTTETGGSVRPLTPAEVKQLGCRPGDVIDPSMIADRTAPPRFTDSKGVPQLRRAYRTAPNEVTGWWDASQMYGFDEPSQRRAKQDPADAAKLLLVPVTEGSPSDRDFGYLPLLGPGDPQNPVWHGQEAVAFPDNYSAGISFFHNVFAREHDAFVKAFRARTARTPDDDCGLRNPDAPDRVIHYRDVTDEELFQIARLVVAAEIAKIHTIEWTTQLLYDEPLYLGMNANWHGLFEKDSLVSKATEKIVENELATSKDPTLNTELYSVFAAGAGIVGLGSHHYGTGAIFERFDPAKTDHWSLKNPSDVNGGVNHFGSPFNFPEEFVSVYRLHPLVPDVIEFRRLDAPNAIAEKIPVVATFRGDSTAQIRQKRLGNWALSMGRQRLGALTLENMPRFLQDLPLRQRIPTSPTHRIDVTALDLIRDREHGIPRFNEFRRQYGLRQLTSFDDFIDHRLEGDPRASNELARERRLVGILGDIYGQHHCDASKQITRAQRNDDGTPINDCLGHPDGSVVDNIEDVDLVVGMLSEFARPHGFAISETQFQVFILNASRRLFSDRFFTSSFRPEFYSRFGLDWVNDNGPDGKVWEKGTPNGHRMEVSPLKRILLRTIPELAGELDSVVNVFDPWARDRGEYYSLAWRPRKGAEADPAFGQGS